MPFHYEILLITQYPQLTLVQGHYQHLSSPRILVIQAEALLISAFMLTLSSECYRLLATS